MSISIKPLEWASAAPYVKNQFNATTSIGDYSVDRYEDSNGPGYQATYGDVTVIGEFATEDEAKAACQADYEDRILAAIDSPPDHGGGEGWVMVPPCPTTDGEQAIASILAGTAGGQRAWQDVIAERRRQVEKGWTPKHDDTHDRGELARAAAYYAVSDVHGFQDDGWGNGVHKRLKPWDITPKADRRENLVIGAAMMIAEIERLDRAALRSQP